METADFLHIYNNLTKKGSVRFLQTIKYSESSNLLQIKWQAIRQRDRQRKSRWILRSQWANGKAETLKQRVNMEGTASVITGDVGYE